MKKFYKSLLTLAFAIVFTTSSFGAAVLVKTMPLGDGITGTGYVRLVVKITDKYIGPDMGIIVHEGADFPGWNGAMGIMMFDLTNGEGPQLRGYNSDAWNTESTKTFAIGDMVAIWFKIDAANDLHSVSAQSNSEDAVTDVFTDFISRESTKGSNTAVAAKYCSVFINDKTGQTTEAIEILKDAEIVSSIEAFDFSTVGTAIASNKLAPAVSVYPTLAQDILNISSAVEISSVKIFSLLGQEVFSGSDSKVIPVSALNSGTYIVEVKTVNNLVSRQKFIKK